MKGRVCELCNEEASLYCGSDSAFLCWSCDARVHGANFLVARHVRHTLCSECNGLAGDTFFGVGFQPHRLICRSCSSEVELETSTDHDSKSSSSSCVSTTESAPKKGGVSRRKAERTGFTSSVSAVSGAEDILVNWCRKLGLNGSCTSVASHALGVCLVKLTVLPLRVSLVAAISCGAKLSGDRSAYTPQNLKRLVEISGVPAKLILAAESKLARVLKMERRRPRHVRDREEGWAECSGEEFR
ncbi:hypothetical protein AAG906_021675 [Vitis piasezkii]